MNCKIIKHENLLLEEGLKIAYLKNQHWPYGIESQILWMHNNIRRGDVHLLVEDDSVLKAYCALVALNTVIDGVNNDCLGVGGVCVDVRFQHSGLGKSLMQEVKRYVNSLNKVGILLCKDALVNFYEKCGWNMLNYNMANIANNNYKHCIMLLEETRTCLDVLIDRNF